MQSHNQAALKSHFKPAFLWLRDLTAAMKEERTALSPLLHWMQENILWRCICSWGRMLGLWGRKCGLPGRAEKSLIFLFFSNKSACLQVNPLWPDSRGGRKKRSACGPLCFERQQAWKNLLPSVPRPFGKAHSVVGMQDICVTLSSCDTVILEDFLPYRQEFCGGWCSTHRLAFPLASSGLLHLLYGWLCLQATGSMIHELSSIPMGNNWGLQ